MDPLAVIFDITQGVRDLAVTEGDRIADETAKRVTMTEDERLTLAAKVEVAILGAVITELENRRLIR